MNIFEKLLAIQGELKAPKSQYNAFGGYKYRNCEDILEAVKPHCITNKAVLFVTDKIVYVEGRHYVEATATLVDCEKPDCKISVTASAREEESKKGMDGSQITGASSSYARKYALNGLFDIDDTKDSDTTNHGENENKNGKKPNNIPEVPKEEPKQSNYERIITLIAGTKVSANQVVEYVTEHFGAGIKVNSLNPTQFNEVYNAMKNKLKEV